MFFETDSSVRRGSGEADIHRPEHVSPQGDLDPLSIFASESEIVSSQPSADLDDAIDDRLATLSGVAEEISTSANALDAQNQAIDHGLGEVTQAAEMLTTLESQRLAPSPSFLGSNPAARVWLAMRAKAFTRRAAYTNTPNASASLTEKDQSRRKTEQVVAELEQRAADATAQLERRVGDFEARKQIIEQKLAEFDAQKQTIDQKLVEATQVAGLLSTLETRISQLNEYKNSRGRSRSSRGSSIALAKSARSSNGQQKRRRRSNTSSRACRHNSRG